MRSSFLDDPNLFRNMSIDPDDWKATPLVDWSSPWSRVLLSGRIVWVKSHFLAMLVQTEDGVIY